MVFGLFNHKINKKEDERYLDFKIKEIVKITADAVNIVFDTLDQDLPYQSGQFITLIDEINGLKSGVPILYAQHQILINTQQ